MSPYSAKRELEWMVMSPYGANSVQRVNVSFTTVWLSARIRTKIFWASWSDEVFTRRTARYDLQECRILVDLPKSGGVLSGVSLV